MTDGSRFLKDREKLEALRCEIAKGLDDYARGDVMLGNEAFKLLREKAAARIQAVNRSESAEQKPTQP